MGRGKLKMELIEKEQSRWTTFEKRKKCLKNKAYEFSTLCNVKTCMIIYGPKLKGQTQRTAEIWPEQPVEVMKIIKEYRASESPGVKSFHLLDYFLRRQKKISDDIAKIRRSYMKAKYPMMNDQINQLSLDQIGQFIMMLDTRIEAVKRRIIAVREENRLASELFSSQSGLLVPQPNLFNQKSVQSDPFGKTLPYSCFRDQIMPLDLMTSMDNPGLMWMMMNGSDRSTYNMGAASTSSNKERFNNSFKLPLCYDRVAGIMENAVLDNKNSNNQRGLVSSSFCGPMYQMLSYGQCSMLPSIPSETHSGFQLNGFYQEMNRHENNEETMF